VVAGMVLSEANFTLYFQATQGRARRAIVNRAFLAYLGIILSATVLMSTSLYAFDYQDSLVFAFREGLSQSASLLTATAFSTADWNSWDPLSQGILMLLMAIGSSAGLSSGGIKAVRVVLLVRHAGSVPHDPPRAVTPLKLGNQVVPERLRTAFLGFFFVYAVTLAVGTLLIALPQVPLGSAFGVCLPEHHRDRPGAGRERRALRGVAGLGQGASYPLHAPRASRTLHGPGSPDASVLAWLE
jgi:trk system potassium uptake protein TrkH